MVPRRYLIWAGDSEPTNGAFTWALEPIERDHTRLVSRIRLRYQWTEAAVLAGMIGTGRG